MSKVDSSNLYFYILYFHILYFICWLPIAVCIFPVPDFYSHFIALLNVLCKLNLSWGRIDTLLCPASFRDAKRQKAWSDLMKLRHVWEHSTHTHKQIHNKTEHTVRSKQVV